MTLFLIAHKVRNVSAFDIALRCDSMGTPDDPGPWWIIPTSGHRAFPFWNHPMNLLVDKFDLMGVLDRCPADCPDHYSCNDCPTATAVSDILDILGLKPKPVVVRRRV